MMSSELQVPRLLSQFLTPSTERQLVLLTGARQTGKTTLARSRYGSLRYINLDAPENREAVRKVPSAAWGRSIGDAIVDEAQKEPIVFDKLKYAFDSGDVRFSLLLAQLPQPSVVFW